MKEYVLVHPKFFNSDKVLLILKERPAWQKGRLNLVGGKVEPGEKPEEAAIRELQEESGLGASKVFKCGEIIGNDCIVHCFVTDIKLVSELKPREEEDEYVSWYSWKEIKGDYRLMPNLRIIIPLLHTETKGWRIVDQESSVGVDCHKISVELPIDVPFING